MTDQITKTDLQDYAAIAKYIPEAKPKQVKWIKEMLDMARELNFQDSFGECSVRNMLHLQHIENPRLKLQLLASTKRSFALELRERRLKRTEPTDYEESGQLGLFHPEAFQGGDNHTLREF